MVIQISDSGKAGDLTAYLRRSGDAVVEQTGPHNLEITLLGSYSNTAMAKRIGSSVRAWKASTFARGCRVMLDPS